MTSAIRPAANNVLRMSCLQSNNLMDLLVSGIGTLEKGKWLLSSRRPPPSVRSVVGNMCYEQNRPSGPRQTVYNLFNAFRARLTLARMSVAEAVQINGLGFSLCT